MSSQPARSYLVIAAAIVIAAFLISISVFVAVGGAKTTTITTASITTTTITTVILSSTSTESAQSSHNTTVGYDFYYSIDINYSGSWNLAYWGQDGNVTQNNAVYCNECYGGVMHYNVSGNRTGSGNYSTGIGTYGLGNMENVLCVEAAILNAPSGTLTLTVASTTGIATAPINPTVEVCATFGV